MPETTRIELILVIVNYGQGSKVLKTAQQRGVMGGTVFAGMGTMKNRILEFLELSDIRKELVLMAAEKSVADTALMAINQEFELHKPYHGIAFSMPLSELINARHQHLHNVQKGAEQIMYQSIMVIVDKGKAELAMESATQAGARGGTIIKARGAGSYESGKLFHMDIEPEKEIVLILSESESAKKITAAISDRLDIGKSGNGIILCQDVSQTYGVLSK